MAFWNGGRRVAVSVGPRRVRLLLARGNGHAAEPLHLVAELPEGVVRGRLTTPAFADEETVGAALDGLLEQAREAGLLRRPPVLVGLVVPDGCVRLAATPLQGPPPRRAEGERMARWALRDLLPVPEERVRASWTVLGAAPVAAAEGPAAPREGGAVEPSAEVGAEPERWLVSVGGDQEVLGAYERLLGSRRLPVGRLLPWTLAAADGLPERTLLLCEGDGAEAALLELGGVPRLHRAWRGGGRAEGQLAALRRYVADRLEAEIAGALLCGEAEWRARLRERLAASTGPTVGESPGLEPAAVLARVAGA